MKSSRVIIIIVLLLLILAASPAGSTRIGVFTVIFRLWNV